MRLHLVTAPTVEPLDLDLDVKPQLRVENGLEDPLLGTYVAAARNHAEAFTRRQFCTATWELWLDAFPCEDWFDLPLPPLQSVTSVKYLDTSSVEQTLSASVYTVSAPAGPMAPAGRVVLKYGEIWPVTQKLPDAVKVRFVAGYGTTNQVPEGIRAGLLLHIGELYARREDAIVGSAISSVPRGVDAALWPFRTWMRYAA